MAKKVKQCFVDVFRGEEITTFDFGSWAIAVFSDEDNDDSVVVYFRGYYIKYFMGRVCLIIDDNFVKTCTIKPDQFNKIKLTVKKYLQSERWCCKLLNLLDNIFSESF